MSTNKVDKKRESHPILVGVVLFFVGISVFFWCKYAEKSKSEGGLVNEGCVIDDATSSDGKENKEVIPKGYTVVVDPGHGGNDPGKVSSQGLLEKDVNLQISIILKQELENRGIDVILTRQEDTNLATEGATNKKNSDMKNRVMMVNEVNPKLLVSIHQNSYTDSSVRGPQVFYNGQSELSDEFAHKLQEKLKEINPQYQREAKEGNDYYILTKSTCPAVIVECGFLSCPEEAALLADEKYQQKIASAIADAIEEAY